MSGGKLPVEFPALYGEDAFPSDQARDKPKSAPYIPFAVVDEKFPRIANAILLQWGCPELDDYFNKLIIDTRGGRQGFPPDVIQALIALHRQHREQFHFQKTGTWIDPLAVAKY
jgi:hypothetical protein